MPQTMFVRNTQSGPTVFDDGEFKIKWEGAGDPGGQDVLPVPAGLAESFGFHRALYLGVLKVEEAEQEIQAALEQHRAAWERQMRGRDMTLASMGQVEEEGTVPREYTSPLSSLPATTPTERGVVIDDGEAKAKVRPAKVIMAPPGSWG